MLGDYGVSVRLKAGHASGQALKFPWQNPTRATTHSITIYEGYPDENMTMLGIFRQAAFLKDV